jgi:hypothetical protein
MANAKKSEHAPRIRDGLCRHVRNKGMYTGGYSASDPNALPYDVTIWWCTRTEKQIGPDDVPCHKDRCVRGRACWEPEDGGGPVA